VVVAAPIPGVVVETPGDTVGPLADDPAVATLGATVSDGRGCSLNDTVFSSRLLNPAAPAVPGALDTGVTSIADNDADAVDTTAVLDTAVDTDDANDCADPTVPTLTVSPVVVETLSVVAADSPD